MTTRNDDTTIDELDNVASRVAPGWALVLYPDHDDSPELLARSWVSPDHPITVVAPHPDLPSPRPTRWPVAVPLPELVDVLEYHVPGNGDPWWADLLGTVVSYLPMVGGLGGTRPAHPRVLGEGAAAWAGVWQAHWAHGAPQGLATLVYCGTAPGDLAEVVEAAEACGVTLAGGVVSRHARLSPVWGAALDVLEHPDS